MEYKIETNQNSRVKLPEGFSTKLEIEKKIIDLINEEDPKWVSKIDKNQIKIFVKPVENSFCLMLRGEGVIDYPYETVKEALLNVELCKKWNTDFYDMEESEIKEVDGHQESLFRMVMKFPWPLSDRDFVQRRYVFKTYGNDKSCLTICQSIQHDKYPEKSKPVRAEMMMNAQYITEMNDKQTKIYLLNFADVKINSSVQGLVNSKAPGAQENFINLLTKGCKMVKK